LGTSGIGGATGLIIQRSYNRAMDSIWHRLSSSVHFDPLTLFGLFAVIVMLVFYALEDRGRAFTMAFAGACILGSIYGFLQGAWPFGIVEAIWGMVAIRKWARLAQQPKQDISN